VGTEWERQEGESRLWYQRFRVWLNDPRRSLLGVYRAEWEWRQREKDRKGQKRSDKTPISPAGSWRRAFEHWRWAERAAAYDAHLDRLAPDLVARALHELRNEAPVIARKLATEGVDGGLNREQIRAAMAVLDRAGLSPTARHEITGPGGGPIQHRTVSLDAEQRDRAISTLAAALGAGLVEQYPGADGPVGAGEPSPVGGDLEFGG